MRKCGPLIFGTSYVETQEQRYVFGLWLDLVTRLNPQCDILVVDSASPNLPETPGAEVMQLGDNIGHLTKTGRDGWGRAFCAGLRYAVEEGYRNVVHIETDMLFARPVVDTFAKMNTNGVKIAAPPALPYQFIETGLLFIAVNHIRFRNLIDRYDWEANGPGTIPEVKIAGMTDKHLFMLPFRGMRNDLGQLTAARMATMFPYGMDWVTHADPATYREFIRLNVPCRQT